MVNFITEFHLFYLILNEEELNFARPLYFLDDNIITSLLILHLWFSFDIVLSDFKMLIILCIIFIWCWPGCVISLVTGNTQKKFNFFVLECNIFCP